MLVNRALEALPSRPINRLMLGKPSRLYFNPSVCIDDGGKQSSFLMVKSSSLYAYNLTLAMVAWWVSVSESPANPGQKRKSRRIPSNLLLGMHLSSVILDMSKLKLRLCLSGHFYFFPRVMLFSLFQRCRIILGSIEFDFLYSLFLCWGGGIITCNHAKLRIGWFLYPLFFTSLKTLIMSSLRSGINTRSLVIFSALQDFVDLSGFSWLCKIFLTLQDFLDFARFSWLCKIFLTLQDFLDFTRFSWLVKNF